MHKPVIAVSCVALLLLAGPLQADEDDLDTQLMRATLKIEHAKSLGTGFILSRPDPRNTKRNQFVLVTAAHVFENIPGDEATLHFRKESEGEYQKTPIKLVIRKTGKSCWTRHPTQDVAVMVVAPPEKADLPKLPADLLATDRTLKTYKVHPGDRLCCLGYPHRIQANAAGFAILRSGPIASSPITPTQTTKTFLLSTNTFEGDSGGPVYLADPKRTVAGKDKPEDVRLILDLVTRQLFLDEEMKGIYGATKVRHRLGIAIVVHASFIRETLNRLP